MNRLPVAIHGQRAKAEPLMQRLKSAGIHAELHDELRLEKLWESDQRAPFVRLEVRAEQFERACHLLHEWDRADGALRDALRCPECKSLRIAYPQFTRKFFLPNLMMGVFSRLGFMEKEFYCEECHFTWPLEGTKPRRDRPNMAPYYFIEGIEQTRAPEPRREAA
jgi:hypothetical protein